ncbi:unnamed protein product [Arctogadus glacialis]
MGGPPEELRNGLLDDTRRQSSRTNSTRVVASMVPVYSPRKGNSKIHGLLSKTCLEFTKVVGIIPSPVDHSKVAKSATQTHASHCKRAPSPTTKVTSDPTPLSVTPTLKPG